MRKIHIALLTLTGVVLLGCNQEFSNSDLLPQSQSGGSTGEVQLMVTAAADPEGGLLITATARNTGRQSFRYQATCGRPDMEFRFTDANGHEIQVTNPCEPQPMMDCPTALGVELAPGQAASTQHWWSGQLWESCTGTSAMPGSYKVTVTFSYYQGFEFGREDVVASVTFAWGELVVRD